MKNIPWGLVALLGVGAFVYFKRKTIADKLNPASDKNVVYTSVNKLVQTERDPNATIGTKVYEWLHPVQDAQFRREFTAIKK